MKTRREAVFLRLIRASGARADQVLVSLPDNWNFNSSNPCLYRGGNYNNRNTDYGLFYVNYNGVSNSNGNIGCRHLVKRDLLPDLTMFSMHG